MEGELTPQEQAYVQSGGETELPETPEVEVEQTPAEEKPVEVKEKVETVVPQAALHQEREHRKAIQREKEASDIRAAKLEERLNLLLQASQPEAPKVDDDPVAYFRAENERTQNQLNQLAQHTQQRQQQEQVQQYQGSVINAYKASVAETSKASPDFNDAYQHLISAQIEALVDGGYSQQEALIATQQNEFAIVERALREGRNPSEAMYKMAKKLGYQPKAKANGAEKLDNVARGQQENKSLGGARGGGAPDLSIESILAMSDAEIAKLKPDDYKKLMT